jgi:membrane protein
VILVGPILMVTATGLMASVSSSEVVRMLSDIQPHGSVLVLVGRLVPYVLVVLVFAFVYSFVPNTRVKFTAALIGAAVAGAAWSVTGVIFATFVVGSTRYEAIYSSFAIGLIALIWLYLSWLILLIGAQLAFYVQHPEALRSGRRLLRLSLSHTEELALAMMYRVGQAFRDGARLDFVQLSTELAVPARALSEISDRLEAAGLLVATEEGCFMPGREMNRIALEEILQAVRGPQDGRIDAPVQSVMASVRSSVHEGLKGRNLAGLVDESSGS